MRSTGGKEWEGEGKEGRRGREGEREGERGGGEGGKEGEREGHREGEELREVLLYLIVNAVFFSFSHTD